MTACRVLLFAHCFVAAVCIGVACVAFNREAASDMRFSRKLEVLIAYSGGPLVYLYVFGYSSSFGFPIGLAYATRGRMVEWRRRLVVIADTFLGMVQFFALVASYPVRY